MELVLSFLDWLSGLYSFGLVILFGINLLILFIGPLFLLIYSLIKWVILKNKAKNNPKFYSLIFRRYSIKSVLILFTAFSFTLPFVKTCDISNDDFRKVSKEELMDDYPETVYFEIGDFQEPFHKEWIISRNWNPISTSEEYLKVKNNANDTIYSLKGVSTNSSLMGLFFNTMLKLFPNFGGSVGKDLTEDEFLLTSFTYMTSQPLFNFNVEYIGREIHQKDLNKYLDLRKKEVDEFNEQSDLLGINAFLDLKTIKAYSPRDILIMVFSSLIFLIFSLYIFVTYIGIRDIQSWELIAFSEFEKDFKINLIIVSILGISFFILINIFFFTGLYPLLRFGVFWIIISLISLIGFDLDSLTKIRRLKALNEGNKLEEKKET